MLVCNAVEDLDKNFIIHDCTLKFSGIDKLSHIVQPNIPDCPWYIDWNVDNKILSLFVMMHVCRCQLQVTFDPEIFFNVFLPVIIFEAGFSMKRVSF